MCDLYDREIAYFKRMGQGMDIGERCVKEMAIKNFDSTKCKSRADCKKYIEDLES